MRILFAADILPNPDAGAEGTEWQTIEALRRLGYEIDTIWADELSHRIRHGNLHYLLELPRAYRDIIRKRCAVRDYDVLHVNQGHCYLAAIDHLRLGRRGVFVCRSHGLDDHMEQVLRPWRKRLGVRARRGAKALAGQVLDALLHRHDRLAYRYASGVLVSSSLDAEYLVDEQGVPRERVGCIAQAPAAAFVDTDALPMNGERLRHLLHVGGLAYWKGFHAIVDAVNRLLCADASLSMTWVCRVEDHGGVSARLMPEVRHRVKLVGWVTQEELCRLFDRHGVFLSPSLFEGFNKAFLEAMARGLCVIGTPTGGMRDILRNGENGLLVGYHDPQGIVAAVTALRAEPQRAETMSAAAARDARGYSWDRVGSETADYYRRLLALGPRSMAERVV